MKKSKNIRLSDESQAWIRRYGGSAGSQVDEDLLTLIKLVQQAELGLAGLFNLSEAKTLCRALENAKYEPLWILMALSFLRSIKYPMKMPRK